MSDSITIEDGKATHRVGEGARQTPQKTGRVVPLTQANDYSNGKTNTIQHKAGETVSEQRGSERVSVGSGESALPDEFGSIRDPQGNKCGNMQAVTDNHSIQIGGTRCTIKVAENLGLIARNAQGEIMIVKQGVDADGKPSKPATPLHKTESLKTHDDQVNINALNSRVPEGVTNAFMGHMVASIVDGTSAQSALSDYAQAVGEPEAKVHEFAESYINNLMNQGIAYAVKSSKGTVTTGDIMEHLPKLSKGYQKSLLLGLHLNNLRSAQELIQIVREKKIV